MMYMSEEDVEVLERFTVELFAGKLGVQVVVPDSVSDILLAIRTERNDVGDSIDRFFMAYRNWFDFHRRIEEAGHAGSMSDAEHAEFIQFGREKDDARDALIQLKQTL